MEESEREMEDVVCAAHNGGNVRKTRRLGTAEHDSRRPGGGLGKAWLGLSGAPKADGLIRARGRDLAGVPRGVDETAI